MSADIFPPVEKIDEFMNFLLQRKVHTENIDAWDIGGSKASVAVYKKETGQAFAFWICDNECSNWLGASLSMLPANVAENNIKDGELPKNIAENLHEVMNIGANLIGDQSHQRLVLAKFDPNISISQDKINVILKNPKAQPFYASIDVEGYGTGKMAMIIFA